jgi:hypothetical protein
MTHIPRALFYASLLPCICSTIRAAEFFELVNVTSSTQDSDFYPVSNLIQGPGVGFADTEPHGALGDHGLRIPLRLSRRQ